MDFHAEALRAWQQQPMGTAATPPAEFITAFAIQKMSEAVAGLTESVMRIEERVTALETRKTVTVVPQRGGTIIYEHREVSS